MDLLGDFNTPVGAGFDLWPMIMGHQGIDRRNDNGRRFQIWYRPIHNIQCIICKCNTLNISYISVIETIEGHSLETATSDV